MTYFESAEGVMITRDRALKELIDHGMKDEIDTFIKDMGDRQQYAARDVLQWLGY
jgi:hypothetical protein